MSDIIIESFGALFSGLILLVLIYNIRVKHACHLPGSKLIILGFAFLFGSMLIDITDNFPQLNHFVVIGDTVAEAFLEKVVGKLFGLVLVAIGFYKWLPALVNLEVTQQKLTTINKELDQQVESRTLALENSNQRLLEQIKKCKAFDERLQKQALFDGLTNLPNRILALDRLRQQIGEAQRTNRLVAVSFINVDNFKKVNENLGHAAGDRLLCAVANRLSTEIRKGDTVARFGGDEFIIISGNIVDSDEISSIEARLFNIFNSAYGINNHNLCLSISVGISIFPNDGNVGEILLKKADIAMSHSKALGRNMYSYFTDKMNNEVSRRLSIENQMRGALQRNEFTVFYQPKISLSNARVTGTEALLRWNNPVLGNVSPVEFIPIAEQSGLITEIGKFVLKQAVLDTAKLQQLYDPELTVAVNLSPRQFRDPDLINDVRQVIEQHFSCGSLLELEITESVVINEYIHIDDALERLHELGVFITMDDFGTGYSSLSYLRKFPFDVLKIDKSFVDELSTIESNQTLIKATIDMAHGLNLRVVAEGVETDEQLKILNELGCDYVQGYLFSKPITFTNMNRFLASYNPKNNKQEEKMDSILFNSALTC